MEKVLKKYYKFIFFAIAVFLLYPTFQSGYIFLLDWSVRPEISLADVDWKIDSIVRIINYGLASIVSFGVFQRIYLFAIIFFLGLAGFRLAKNTGNVFAQYFAGIFLIFNPFIYARLVEQPGIALGSLFFFWFLIYFLEYLAEKEKNRKIWAAAILAGLTIASFPHSAFFVATSMVALLTFHFFRNRNWEFILKTMLIVGMGIIILNGNWLFSFASGTDGGVGGMRSFSLDDAKAFETKRSGDHSVYYTVLALQGYWGEDQDRFVSIQENPIWMIAFWAIFLLAMFGLAKQFLNKDIFAKPLTLTAVIAYVLAIGIASPIFAPLANFLYDHFPFYIGLRESQKWAVVLVFFYAYFGSWGIKFLWETKKLKGYRLEIGLLAILLPVIFSFSMIRGMHEHLAPHEFPSEWQAAKKYLQENPTDGKILFLPWHLYMEFDFAGKNVATPAKGFFGKNIIQGNNTETGKVYSHSLDEQTLAIEKYIAHKGNPAEKIDYADFSKDMEKLGIQKIMLTKTEDWQEYSWLDRMNLKKVLENDKLIIYNLRSEPRTKF
ncbi:MAG TPA: hypothetical protein PLB52_00015 [Candidatus Moranbacteria bacterium]|nr:hypothetical protein [Candidatus Moranbacteria bacterium]